MIKEKKFFNVHFFAPVDGRTEYYFKHVSSIFKRFTPEQIGLTMATLQNNPPTVGNPRITRKCMVFARLLTVISH